MQLLGGLDTLGHHPQREAVVGLTKASHRVERVLVDLIEKAKSGRSLTEDDQLLYARAVDALIEVVAVVRLVVSEEGVVSAAERFVTRARKIQRTGDWTLTGQIKLEFAPLLDALRAFEHSLR